MRWCRLMTLEDLTALQGLLRSIVDAEELQQQVERQFKNPGRWASGSPLPVLGMPGGLGCSGTQT
jgi:hypothetical protein